MKSATFLVVIILLILALSHCKKSTEPIGGEKPPPGYQEDIPWPSLADSPWPMAHHDPQNTGRSKLLGPTQGIISWEFDEAYKIYSSVVVGPDSTAYIIKASPGNGLFAFKPDGTLKWRLDIPTMPKVFTTPIITADGTIFCYNGAETVYAVDSDGTIKWSFELNYPTRSLSFAIDKTGIFYYIDTYNSLYTIDQHGNILWNLQDDRFYTYRSYLTFSPDGNVIYILSHEAILLAVDINTKQILWNFRDDVLPGESTLAPANGVMVDSYGNIYLLTLRNIVLAELFVLKPDGEIKWRYKFNTQAVRDNVPTIDKYGNIYCATDSVYSFDFEGNLRWKIGLDNICDCPLICDNNGTVYIGTVGISIIAFDSEGDQLWRIDDNQNQVGGSPAIGFNEIMYFTTWSSDKFYGIK